MENRIFYSNNILLRNADWSNLNWLLGIQFYTFNKLVYDSKVFHFFTENKFEAEIDKIKGSNLFHSFFKIVDLSLEPCLVPKMMIYLK